MKTYYLKSISKAQYKKLLNRPAIDGKKNIKTVLPIIEKVKKGGVYEARKYAYKFDGAFNGNIKVSLTELNDAGKKVPAGLKKAIKTAYKNIYLFHKFQKPKKYSVETIKGVMCKRDFRPIENVGLYIPGGSTVLFSTLLMLAIPAQIAGCKRIVVCSPAMNGVIPDELLYTAKLCGITEFYKIGGAQAIALMAYGDKTIPAVNKIFGPGNQYVTAAKTVVSIDPAGCAIDMPAGPSEILIIADKYANPVYVAADLLSQAEHGIDSQAILVTTEEKLTIAVKTEIAKQLSCLDRKKEIIGSLKSSFSIVTDTIEEALEFSNSYAPEHLILNLNNAEKYQAAVINAGSVFIGQYSTESIGDYASGTNHSLPTYGYAKSHSGVSVEQYMKSISFQKISGKGLKNISQTVITMALAEKLQAHANALKVRLKNEY